MPVGPKLGRAADIVDDFVSPPLAQSNLPARRATIEAEQDRARLHAARMLGIDFGFCGEAFIGHGDNFLTLGIDTGAIRAVPGRFTSVLFQWGPQDARWITVSQEKEGEHVGVSVSTLSGKHVCGLERCMRLSPEDLACRYEAMGDSPDEESFIDSIHQLSDLELLAEFGRRMRALSPQVPDIDLCSDPEIAEMLAVMWRRKDNLIEAALLSGKTSLHFFKEQIEQENIHNMPLMSRAKASLARGLYRAAAFLAPGSGLAEVQLGAMLEEDFARRWESEPPHSQVAVFMCLLSATWGHGRVDDALAGVPSASPLLK